MQKWPRNCKLKIEILILIGEHVFDSPFHILSLMLNYLTHKTYKTRSTQREQNARLLVTSLSSDIKYCTEGNKIKPNM